MKFSIITPTHKRIEKLKRAVESLLLQDYDNWEMIIVNDSPEDNSYANFSYEDSRIKYFVNEKNSGVNYSRNFALNNVSSDSEWIIFLDDDDYLSIDALSNFHSLITKYSNKKWFVTNRAFTTGESVTKFPKINTEYSYVWSYLILKTCKGDATHCINKNLINKKRFSKHITQGDEWLFFYQIGLESKMYYHNHNSTFTDGYDNVGLNFRNRPRNIQLKTLSKILDESQELNLLYHPTFIIYILMRLFRLIFWL